MTHLAMDLDLQKQPKLEDVRNKGKTKQKVFVHKNRASLQLLILYEMLKDRCEAIKVIG